MTEKTCKTNAIASLLIVPLLLILLNKSTVRCDNANKPPYFIPGSGDMARFSLSENTPVDSPVYQLRGRDPEGDSVHFSISGPVFSVDRETGVVRLKQELDREKLNLLEVIISITDDGVYGSDPNTVSLRREIPVRDFNDNPPVFIGRPYSTSISEATPVGSIMEISPNIIVTDRDEGRNADVSLSCFMDNDPDVCETFKVETDQIGEGNFTAIVTLIKPLDYETRSTYVLTLMAKDGAYTNPLSAIASISINIVDVQDQEPVFLNAPYSATLQENSPADTSVLRISAKDGDTGNPRPVRLTLDNERKNYFRLGMTSENGTATLFTTSKPLDREDYDIFQNGGVYSFNVRATEYTVDGTSSDFALTQVTIVVTDENDNVPSFNEASFEVNIPENLERGTPLPGLSIYAIDNDLGVNSQYNLSLRNILNAEHVFEVSPTYGEGRTPVVVRVLDESKLDYDVNDNSLREFKFDLVASVDGKETASSRVTAYLQDVNDNGPIFSAASYDVYVEENSQIGKKITDITATDKDSGLFGRITYVLKGFGSEYFATDNSTGGLYVAKSLNYEQQKSYSLSIVGIDGGGWETTANVFININDVNDNAPQFESREYTRTIREGVHEFEPQFFVRAFDVDGPQQGNGRVAYSIESENSISGHVFSIDMETGEIKIERPVSSMDTERGLYEIIVAATDYGVPSLKNTTKVLVRVGISGNQRPVFKNRIDELDKGDIPGPPRYRVSILENAPAGYNLTTVSATDPDGIDSLLTYRIVGANDNFVIDERTGLVSVSTVARLDRDTNPHQYSLIINAVDSGFPIPETATTTLYIKIDDVNDKPPKFSQQTYTAYVSERTKIGAEVLKTIATDTDVDSKLVYSIVEPIKAASKTGIQLTSIASYDYRHAFRVNDSNGIIYVNNKLNHDLAAEITLTVKAIDLNAAYNKEKQLATAEVNIFVQSYEDTNPIFKNKGWLSSDPVINAVVKEEMPIGSTLFKLYAEDPVTEQPIEHFEIIEPDLFGFFGIDEQTGTILLKKRLDYEALDATEIQFTVKTTSADGERETISNTKVSVENVNDNTPEFDQKIYRAMIVENSKYPEKVLTVQANDADVERSPIDRKIGYGTVTYSLTGSNAVNFIIDGKTGVIQIAPNQTIDREKMAELKFSVIAEDSLGKPTDTRRSTAEVIISVLDVNDNPPMFSQKSYSAVVPENSETNAFVFNISAYDPDEGPGGEVHYDFLSEGDTNGLLRINTKTGEIRTKTPLTGKGRSEPYELIIRAQDNGGRLEKQKSLFTDVAFILYIGDVSANDGTPFFIAPKLGQIANITENATIASPVFQVIASDPDNPTTPSGTLTFSIQDDIDDARAFKIDPMTGLVTTLKPLDRELKSMYKIIIQVSDDGQPPQSATRVLRINVLDIDDHEPRFLREVESLPFEMSVQEEQPPGTVVGRLTAIDEDIDENGAIDYMFVDGNQENLFKIERIDDNSAVITTLKKMDRELAASHLLTVKCFKNGIPHSRVARKQYNNFDFSEAQVLIKIIDIDDHLPEFLEKNPAFGVRLNVPIDFPLITLAAIDMDPDAQPILYQIVNVSFVPQFYKHDNVTLSDDRNLFILNNRTGEIRTGKSLADFVDGYFDIQVRANNSMLEERARYNHIKIYVTRDKSLLRFVFGRPPTEVKDYIDEFGRAVQSRLRSSGLEVNILDTNVLTRFDQSLDFSSTSSCFQLSRHGSVLPPNDMLSIMDSEEVREILLDVYAKYGVSSIEPCSVKRNLTTANVMASAGTWLVILAGVIGVFALVATCTTCCLARKYKSDSKRLIYSNRSPPESYGPGAPMLFTESIYGPM